MLYNYCNSVASECNIKVGGAKKLVLNLGSKGKYGLQYRNFQLYLSSGTRLVGIHRVLKFEQSGWMKKNFDFSTDKRKKASNSFEKDFFKLMNNSVYGKIMENLIKRVNVRLVRDARYCKKKGLVDKLLFTRRY